MDEINLETNTASKKKKNINIWLIIAVSIVAFLVSYFVFDSLLSSESEPKLKVSSTTLSVEYSEYLGYSAKIKGVAKNTTNRNYSYASVEFSVYDASGNNLGTALANINNLGGWRYLEF